MGATFSHMNLQEVGFNDCALDYMSLVDCKLREVILSNCQMEHTLFYGSTQKALSLNACRMAFAEIMDTAMSEVDLSDCDINGIRTAIQMLSGTKVSLLQSPILLSLCGIQVKS